MKDTIISKLEKLYLEFKRIELLLSSKETISDLNKYKKLSKKYLKLSKFINFFLKWKTLQKDIKSTKSLLCDIEFSEMVREELKILREKNIVIEKKLYSMLMEKNIYDYKSCFVEIRAATGGDEAAIFAGDLFKMYGKYAESKNWNVEIMNSHIGEKGGFKEIIIRIIGHGASSKLQFESGGHRVQRVPQTESQGRIHTSTCTVAVIPEIPQEDAIKVTVSDLKIDTFRSSGAGGQHVNTTDSAIRITHIPTGTVVECQDERSQHKNKAKALSILSSRIHASEMEKRHQKNSLIRRNLLGTGDRSDRNRTYNFPKNRVTDHRINFTVYSLQTILHGNLDILIDPIMQEYNSNILSQDIV
ncbi:peptide chain release factor 1 [Buchnera aphidicola]|uniref:peptide chain release factor 1 n=1 Tax=Buchnera aphidicola TaxID=9 RepID=UPI003464DC00